MLLTQDGTLHVCGSTMLAGSVCVLCTKQQLFLSHRRRFPSQPPGTIYLFPGHHFHSLFKSHPFAGALSLESEALVSSVVSHKQLKEQPAFPAPSLGTDLEPERHHNYFGTGTEIIPN
jgi:hypothetical protein